MTLLIIYIIIIILNVFIHYRTAIYEYGEYSILRLSITFIFSLIPILNIVILVWFIIHYLSVIFK